MLHLRLRVPSDLTDEVVDLLGDDATVTNLAVLPGGFRKPPGCLVMADVARENATGVISRLRDLGVSHSGSISVEEIDTILSDSADAAERAAPGAPDDGVVWVSVEQQLRADSRSSWAFVAFIVLAVLIAGVGRILDQPILIVGAMVVGPDFAPIAAICFALARPRLAMLPQAAASLVGGFAIAIAVASVAWTIAYHLGAFTRAQASSGHLTSFIVHPNAWSVVVAVLAGVAGTLSLSTAKSGPLVGVFISVTTIPAAGALAISVASGVWHEAGSALLQLVLNVAGIIVAGSTTLLVQRTIWSRIVHRTEGRSVQL